MDDDFETANAITTIFDFVKIINKFLANERLSIKNCKKIKEFIQKIDKVFCVLDEEKIKIPKEVNELIKKREEARKNKDFKLADKIREKIKSLGYYVEDTKEKAIIKKVK